MPHHLYPLSPAQLAQLDQLKAGAAAVILIGLDGVADIRGLRISPDELAQDLRTIADALEGPARKPRRHRRGRK